MVKVGAEPIIQTINEMAWLVAAVWVVMVVYGVIEHENIPETEF